MLSATRPVDATTRPWNRLGGGLRIQLYRVWLALHESMAHECLKAYVCILYASPCAPLLVLWLGEVEGTSLAIYQANASPVPAHVPMVRVSAVLRRYDDAPTCRRGPSELAIDPCHSRTA